MISTLVVKHEQPEGNTVAYVLMCASLEVNTCHYYSNTMPEDCMSAYVQVHHKSQTWP